MNESALKQFIASEAEYIIKALPEARSSRSRSAAAEESQGQEHARSASATLEEQKDADVRVLQEREPLLIPPIPAGSSGVQLDASISVKKQPKTNAQRALELYETSVFRDLWQYFHLPQEEVLKASKWDRYTFTKLCHDFGIGKWPYKAIASVNLSMSHLEEASRLTKPSVQTIEHVENLLRLLRLAVDDIVAASSKTFHPSPTRGSTGTLADYRTRKKDYRKKKPKKKMSANDTEEDDDTDSDGDQQPLSLDVNIAAEHKRQQDMNRRIRALNKTAVRYAKNMLTKAGVSAADTVVLRKYPPIFYVGKDAPQADKPPGEVMSAAPVLKKGWLEEKEDGRLHVHRLPVRDELLDTLGTTVPLRALHVEEWFGFNTESEFFKQQDKDGTIDSKNVSELPPMKKSKLLCHDGEVVLPPLDLQDTSDINKEGLTIILIEPQIFQPHISTNVVDFVPSFAVRETRHTWPNTE